MNQIDIDVLTEVNRANAFLGEGKCESAIEVCNRLIGLQNWFTIKSSTRISAYCIRASAFEKSDKIDLAIADYEMVRKIELRDFYSAQRLSWIYYQKNDLEKAKLYATATIALAPAIDASMYTLRANVLLKLGRYADCLIDCDKAIALDAKNLMTYIDAITACAFSDQHGKNVAYSTEALKLAPKCGQLFLTRGIAFANLDQNLKAIEDFKSAIKNNKVKDETEFLQRTDVLWCQKLLIGSLFKLHKFADAIKVCDRQLRDHPEDSMLLKARAESLSKLGKFRDSIEAFKLALAKEKDSKQLSKMHGQTALCYSRVGDAKEAIKHYDLAISFDDNNALAFNNKAWILAHLGKLDDAEIEIEKALFLHPNTPNYLSTRGLIFYRKGQTDLAIKDFEQALSAKPDIEEAFIFLTSIAANGNATDCVSKKLLTSRKFSIPVYSTIAVS